MSITRTQSNDNFECSFLRDPFDEHWFDYIVC